MERELQEYIINHLSSVEKCFLDFMEFLSEAKNPEAAEDRIKLLSYNVSRRETDADFCLIRITEKSADTSKEMMIDEFSSLCDSFCNRLEDFAKEISSQTSSVFFDISNMIAELTASVFSLFICLKDAVELIASLKINEAKMKRKDIQECESKLDIKEKEIFSKILLSSAPQDEKMQTMSLVNKISKLPDVIKKASDIINAM